VLHPEHDARSGMPAAMMAEALECGKWEGTVTRMRKDGSVFTARVVMTRRCTEDGEPIGFLLMSKDITDELSKLTELEQSKALGRREGRAA
jgi:PAS domain S-box-containing protein